MSIQNMEKQWTTSDLIRLYRLTDSSKTPIIYAEEKGEIPLADRVSRGKIQVRKWNTHQLPDIGKKFGFMKTPASQVVADIYTPKGGVGKTTFTANLARMAAINGIKTIVCGLDFQRSVSRYLVPSQEIKSLDELEETHHLGLHHYLFEGADLSEVVQKTNIPNLDIIPETSDLNFMAKKIRLENRREYVFKERLLPKLKKYDLVLFDGNPGWSDLTENALVASSTIIMPIACEAECYDALKENLGEIEEFRKSMHINWDHYYMVPTFLENTSVSQNIYARYLNQFEGIIIPIPIRRSVLAQEARFANMSIIEYSPTSNLATDYYDLVSDLWNKLLEQEGELDEQ